MSIAITAVPDSMGERSSQNSLSVAKIKNSKSWEGLISALAQTPCLPKYLSQNLVSMTYIFWPTILKSAKCLSHSCQGLVTYQTPPQSTDRVRPTAAVRRRKGSVAAPVEAEQQQ